MQLISLLILVITKDNFSKTVILPGKGVFTNRVDVMPPRWLLVVPDREASSASPYSAIENL